MGRVCARAPVSPQPRLAPFRAVWALSLGVQTLGYVSRTTRAQSTKYLLALTRHTQERSVGGGARELDADRRGSARDLLVGLRLQFRQLADGGSMIKLRRFQLFVHGRDIGQ